MYFCEKLKNNLRDVVRYFLVFFFAFSMEKISLDGGEENFFEKMKEDGAQFSNFSHQIPELIFQLFTQLNSFCYYFLFYYQTHP